jgi:hypothetical protein
MSPTQKARHVLSSVAKKMPITGRHAAVPPHGQLASLIVGGLALVTAGLALVLVVREKI